VGQIHKRITDEQIRFLFGAYVHGHIKRIDVQEALVIGKRRLSGLLGEDRQGPPKAPLGWRGILGGGAPPGLQRVAGPP